MMTYSGSEAGKHSSVSMAGDQVTKLSLKTYDYETAQHLADDITQYAAALAAEPLRTAALRDVTLAEVQMSAIAHPVFRIRHTYDRIDGPSVASLLQPEREKMLAMLLADVADMSTIQDSDRLLTPFDGLTRNFHADGQDPVLVDIFPALLRNPDGSFPIHSIGGPSRGNVFPWSMGTKTGAIVKLLSSAVDRGDVTGKKLKHIARATDDWCYDVLPSTLHPEMAASVRKQIQYRFIPFLGRCAAHKIGERIEGSSRRAR